MNKRKELIPELFDEMKKEENKNKYPRPNNQTYNLLIQYYISNKQLNKAEKVFYSMMKRDCENDIRTQTHNQTQTHDQEYQDNHTKPIQTNLNQDIIQPNLINYNTMLNGYLKNNKPILMKKLFEILKNNKIEPDSITYLNLITIQTRRKYTNNAIKLFNEMKNKYNIKPTIEIYNSLLNGFSISDDFNNLMKYYKELKEEYNFEPDLSTFSILIKYFFKNQKLNEAENMYFELINNYKLKPDLTIMCIMIDGYSKNSKIKLAEKYFKKLKKLKLKPNLYIYGALLNGYSLIGQIEKSESLVRNLFNNGLELNSVLFRTLITCYSNSNNFDKIYNLISNYPNQHINTYNLILKACLNFNKSPIKIINLMELKNIKSNNQTSMLLNEIYKK
eukprot:gene1928-1068_t